MGKSRYTFALMLISVFLPLPQYHSQLQTGQGGAETQTASQYKIAFTVSSGETRQIYITDLEGKNVIALTTSSSSATDSFYPVWSPDGKRLAFTSYRPEFKQPSYLSGFRQIDVMDIDSAGVAKLTNIPADNFQPVWSPDGRRIAFTSDRDENWEIYVINVDGTGLTNLTRNPAMDYGAGWSPDGRRIAFTSGRDGNGEVYVMNPDGTDLKNLTNTSYDDQFWHWSPDGGRLVTTSAREDEIWIYKMDADGKNASRLTRGRPYGLSPDGKLLAFDQATGTVDMVDIFVMKLERKDVTSQPILNFLSMIIKYVTKLGEQDVTNLTYGLGGASFATWSPDGKYLAFVSKCDGEEALYVVEANGRNRKCLTRNLIVSGFPAWQPMSGGN